MNKTKQKLGIATLMLVFSIFLISFGSSAWTYSNSVSWHCDIGGPWGWKTSDIRICPTGYVNFYDSSFGCTDPKDPKDVCLKYTSFPNNNNCGINSGDLAADECCYQVCRKSASPPVCMVSSWGACSVTCGGGTRTSNCGTTQTCNTQACCTPSVVLGPWVNSSNWSTCNSSGKQTLTSTRTCTASCGGDCSVEETSKIYVRNHTLPICSEGQTRNQLFLNNYCLGLNVLSNISYEICSNSQWIKIYVSPLNQTCNGGISLENQYCSGNNLVQNWSQPTCNLGTCGREFFQNQTVCEYGCSNNSCNSQPIQPGILFLNIISPQPITYTNNTILVNLSSNGNSNWYSWNNLNVTYTSLHPVTFNNGTNTLHAWTNNSTESGVYKNVTFYINTTGGNNGNETNQTAPIITIHSPSNIVYQNISQVLLNATANQLIINWSYSLNGGANITFPNANSFNLTTIVGNLINGTNTLLVCGTNLNGTGCSSVSFQVNLSTNGNDKDEDNGGSKGKCRNCDESSSEYENVISLGNVTTNAISLYKNTGDEKTGSRIWIILFWVILVLIVILIALFIILNL